MAFLDDAARSDGDRVTLHPQDEAGLLDLDALLGAPPPDTLVYCCGPEPLLAAVEERCAAWPPGTLHVERFAPEGRGRAGARPVRSRSSWRRAGRTLTVPPDRSSSRSSRRPASGALLVPRGHLRHLRDGVLGGEPDHRDSLLTADEQAADDTMIICVSRAGVPEAGARPLSRLGAARAEAGDGARRSSVPSRGERAGAGAHPRSGPARRAARSPPRTGWSPSWCAWGALERGDDGRYRIGLRLWEVGALAPRGLGLREAALPFMEDLYEVTHENVQLAVREDLEVVFVERIAGRDAVAGATPGSAAGSPCTPTGVGLVLLAHAPVEVQDEVLAGAAAALHRAHGHRSRGSCARCSPRSGATGYAVSDRQVTTDAVSVAAPIEVRGTVVAALSIVVRGSSAAAVRTMTPGVRAAARGISRTLASQPS